jgi:hypothetical protein
MSSIWLTSLSMKTLFIGAVTLIIKCTCPFRITPKLSSSHLIITSKKSITFAIKSIPLMPFPPKSSKKSSRKWIKTISNPSPLKNSQIKSTKLGVNYLSQNINTKKIKYHNSKRIKPANKCHFN